MTRIRPRTRGVKRTPRHKFKAKPRVVSGFRFDSRKEAARFEQLELLREHGQVLFALRQVGFDLTPPLRSEDGKQVAPGERYRADFVVFWADGTVTIEDVKGHRTPEYLRKKVRVEALYGIEIQEL